MKRPMRNILGDDELIHYLKIDTEMLKLGVRC